MRSLLANFELFWQVTPALLHWPVDGILLHSLRYCSIPVHSTLLKNTGLFSDIAKPSVLWASKRLKSITMDYCLLYIIPSGSYSSCRQTTLASLMSHWSVQTVPHVLYWHISTRPLEGSELSVNLTSPSLQLVFGSVILFRYYTSSFLLM